MKLKTKIIADKYAGAIALFVLSISKRFFGKSDVPTLPKHITKIIVSKYYGMGSIIQSTPLLKSLRENYPKAEITFVTTVANRELLSQIPFVEKCIVINTSGFFSLLTSFIRMFFKVRSLKADLFIDLETFSNFATAVASLSKAKYKSGTSYRESKMRSFIYDSVIEFNNEATIAENYLRLLPHQNFNTEIQQLFPFPEDDNAMQSVIEKVNRLLNGHQKNIILINANASDLCMERRWPLENFILLAQSLSKKYSNCIFLFTGSENEFDLIDEIKKYPDKTLQKNIFNICGMFSFAEFNALLRMSYLVITNDTGPMHLALAKKTNLVALFGPNTPYRYLKNNNSEFIYEKVACSPCIHLKVSPPCNGNNICMKHISVQTVFNACETLLKTAAINHTKDKTAMIA